ncbi:2-oxoglutarate dehydrogenase, E2 component, dihydrolipoamide succinyltransferase [Balneolaceae bacterium YR4-1]|uniref:Dihydrolipoamide acetyltransferase component of pyruvate dehydrogenase complex n=1 Tax=Halalkalibaculum roseum TaxID=2709311 RepID=A0A6M1SW59_9BACT|nr:2-oxoglutarate dehydrogenase, E2 component, dihydrolipoamide succinyltransferase [Halalkalibaculum roseum]NGP75224.1 2-oxoglutarate dehydrogenase, E2 component, dihydrolipoamide succinyltransferase [Halalkalibaculum roseum]
MARVEVEMPQMGESVMEGTVIEWTKSVGDKVEEDETLLEIATDKVDTEVPSPQAGILVEILAEEGETIEVGQAIAVIETDPDAADTGSTEGGAAKSEAKEEQKEEAEEPAAQAETESEKETETATAEKQDASGDNGAQDEGERVEVQMPKMGESVMEGTVIEWTKNIGDTVEEDETLLEISTDKVDTEVPSPQAGTLVEILAEEGETIEVGQTIAIIATGKAASGAAKESSSAAAKEKETKKQSSEEKKKEPATVSANGAPSGGGTEPQRIGSDGRFYSPLVRSIAKEEGISQEELESIEGSGQGGRVSKDDIMQYLEERGSQKAEPAREKQAADAGLSKPVSDKKEAVEQEGAIKAGQLNVQRPSGDVEIVKMDRMRKMIADHMVKSKQTSAHVTTFAEVDVTNLVRWREANKKKFQERSGTKLTYTPLFIEKIIQAIREFPLINSSVNVEDSEIMVKRDINFGLAVALGEGGEGGLIVPVIKKAQEKNLVGLAEEVSDLASKARNKNLSPDDLVGGTITLTNYGSVGNLMGTPIINQPQVAIIGTGVIEKRPVVMETDQGDVIAIRQMMYLSMSYDHRIIDGAHGGAFLNRVKELLENFDTDRAV